MAVYKRGAVWYLDFMIEGVRYRSKIPTARNKTEAIVKETEKRAEVLSGHYERRETPPLFAKFLKIYLEWAETHKRSYKQDLSRSKVLTSYFGNMRIDRIRRLNIEAFKKERLTTKVCFSSGATRPRTPATVNREIQLLSSVFTMAYEDGIIRENPCRKIKKIPEDNERNRVLSAEEETRLFETLDDARFDRLRPVVEIALQTGIRRGALLKLEWRDLDFADRIIKVRKAISKSGKEYFVPMNDAAFQLLSGLKAEFGGQRQTVFGLKCIKRAWDKAIELAEVKDFTFHCLRHSFATRLVENNTYPTDVQELLGHARFDTTRRYVHSTNERKREAVQNLKRRVD